MVLFVFKIIKCLGRIIEWKKGYFLYSQHILEAALFMAHRVGKYILQRTLGEGSLGK